MTDCATTPGQSPLADPVGKVVHAFWKWLAVAIMVVGAVIRLRQYLADRPLWGDEASLAISMIKLDFAGLTGPLHYNQAAPLGFLWAEKAIESLWGYSEYALRLFPLIAGIVALLLICLVAREIMGRAASLCSVAMAALNWKLIYYSSEVKQYSSDTAWCLLVVWLTLRIINGRDGARDCLAWLIAILVAGWFCQPVWFFIPMLWLVLLPELMVHQMVRARWPFWSALFIGLNLILVFFVTLSRIMVSPALLRFWAETFMPMPPWRDTGWFVRSFAGFMNDFVGMQGIVAGCILLGGAIALSWRKWRYALVICGAVPLMLLASAFNLYPIWGRLLLFLIPFVLLVNCWACEQIAGLAGKLSRRLKYPVLFLLVAVLMAPQIARTWGYFRCPMLGDGVRDLLYYLRDHQAPGDAVFVYNHNKVNMRVIEYYGHTRGLQPRDLQSCPLNSMPPVVFRRLNRLLENKRIWIMTVLENKENKGGSSSQILEYMEQRGRCRDERIARGCLLRLYELDRPVSRAPPVR